MALFQNLLRVNQFFRSSKFKLVYLHIEKSAGTSQRIFFYENFKSDLIHWYDIDSDTKTLITSEIKEKKILGGHRFFDFYNYSNYLYLTVVRDPIESVFSLYNFFITQTHHINNWQKKDGFDPLSFEKTLINCAAFRNRIENTQCRYFGKTKSFNEAKYVIKKYKFLLGSLPYLDTFNQVLFDSLNISDTKFPRVNVAKFNYQKKFILSQSCMNLLKNLLAQDILLYQFVIEQHNGLYQSITNKDWKKLNLKPI